MNTLDQTRAAVADLSRLRKYLDAQSLAWSLCRILVFAAVFWATTFASSSLFGLNPLVVTWCVSVALLAPLILRDSVGRFEKSRNGWLVVAVIWGVTTAILVLANDPLWVKRMTSVFAAFQVLGFLFWPSLLGKTRLERMVWNPELFKKTRVFQIPVSFAILIINEGAISTNNDWAWIASMASCRLIVPIVIVLTAKFPPARSL